MKAVDPNASVSSILWDLQTTGKPVTGSNGLTRPRIRVLAASTMLSDTGFNSGAVFTGPGVDVASAGIGLAATGSGSLPVAVPGTATIRAAYLYWMTSGGPDNSATFQGSTVSGTLVGASRPCPGGLATPFRLYRAVVTTAVTPGTKTYAVSGIGGGVVVGQGASLVVVHGTPGAPVGRVAIRQGALTVFSGTGAKSQTFPNLLVPSSPTQAGLHVGMAGGSAGATQAPLTLSSLDVGTTNYAQGSGGPKWDNVQTPLTPAQITATLPVGTTTLVNSMPDAMSGCLAWGYSALSYR